MCFEYLVMSGWAKWYEPNQWTDLTEKWLDQKWPDQFLRLIYQLVVYTVSFMSALLWLQLFVNSCLTTQFELPQITAWPVKENQNEWQFTFICWSVSCGSSAPASASLGVAGLAWLGELRHFGKASGDGNPLQPSWGKPSQLVNQKPEASSVWKCY